jgi:hypothetical protein
VNKIGAAEFFLERPQKYPLKKSAREELEEKRATVLEDAVDMIAASANAPDEESGDVRQDLETFSDTGEFEITDISEDFTYNDRYISGLYEIEAPLDNILCHAAKVSGFNVLVFTKLTGVTHLIQEAMDTRSHEESLSNLLWEV